MLSLYTQRPAIRPFVSRPLPLYYDQSGLPVGDVDDLTHILKACRVRYLVQTPLHFAQLLEKFRRAHTDWLIPVYEGDDHRFRIFEMHFPPEEALPRSRGANHGAAGAQAGL